MKSEDFHLLSRLEEHHWWFSGMRGIVDAVAARELETSGARVLDAGCGTGFNLIHYAARHELYGIDIAVPAIEGVKARGFSRVARASIARIPFPSDTFDLVFSFEVITQTPREMHDRALRELHRVLKRGGHLVVRVPAFMWLWSSHDEQLEVHYRYSRKELEERLRACGFTVTWSSYANGLLFPLVVVRRLLKHVGLGSGSDVRPMPRGFGWLERALRNALLLEARWFQAGGRLPFGSSVLCHARK